MQRLSLDGKWRFRRVDGGEWLDAAVPGSVLHDLLKAGRIEDPFYRENELKAKEIASRDYEYEREFTAGKELLACKNLVLRCEGLDTLADVSINGKPVISANNMYRTYEADVGSLLNEDCNSIRILLHSPVRFIDEKHNENPLWGTSDAMAGFPHIRKGHSMFGWDWGPQIPDSGIWRSMSILGFEQDRLDDVYIIQKHDAGTVRLDIRVRMNGWANSKANGGNVESSLMGSSGKSSGAGVLQIRVVLTSPCGKIVEKCVTPAGREEHILLKVENPELWWPNGYGSQPLYNVRVELLGTNELTVGKLQIDELPAGELLDSRCFDIGLRTVRVKREKDQWGESFEFEINGVSIFAMGADYIPEDNLLPRCSRERTEKLIKSCIEANFNCIRVWGGGYYPEDYFYELCDQYGLLVWQDFMFACAVYELTDEFAENISKEAEDNIKRLRHHASLAIWCGNNEMEEAWKHWDFPKTEKHRSHYLKMFEEILPKAAAEHDPQTFYWPSSPSSGGGFDNPNDENRGDVHYWDVWHGLKPFTDYRKFTFRFVSEFGFQSFPGMKTVETFTLPEDRNIFSTVMESHQKNGSANGKILYYLSENFKYPKDFDSLLYTSQLLQAEAIKYGVEHWRRNRGRCMGAIYWQLNDCWPVASWASIDYYGRWKALHYFAKRFYAPVLLTACEDGLKVSLHVSNETMQDFSGEVRWQLRDSTSHILGSGSAKAAIGTLDSGLVCELDFGRELAERELQRRCYLEFRLYRGNEPVSGGTLLFVKNKHFEFTDPKIKAAVDETEDEFLIELSSEAYARYVGLDLAVSDCIFDDNCFDLSAGETKLIRVRKDTLSVSLSLSEFKAQLQIKSIYSLA